MYCYWSIFFFIFHNPLSFRLPFNSSDSPSTGRCHRWCQWGISARVFGAAFCGLAACRAGDAPLESRPAPSRCSARPGRGVARRGHVGHHPCRLRAAVAGPVPGCVLLHRGQALGGLPGALSAAATARLVSRRCGHPAAILGRGRVAVARSSARVCRGCGSCGTCCRAKCSRASGCRRSGSGRARLPSAARVSPDDSFASATDQLVVAVVVRQRRCLLPV